MWLHPLSTQSGMKVPKCSLYSYRFLKSLQESAVSHMLNDLLSQKEGKKNYEVIAAKVAVCPFTVLSRLFPPCLPPCSKSHFIFLCDKTCCFPPEVGNAASSETPKPD